MINTSSATGERILDGNTAVADSGQHAFASEQDSIQAPGSVSLVDGRSPTQDLEPQRTKTPVPAWSPSLLHVDLDPGRRRAFNLSTRQREHSQMDNHADQPQVPQPSLADDRSVISGANATIVRNVHQSPLVDSIDRMRPRVNLPAHHAETEEPLEESSLHSHEMVSGPPSSLRATIR